MSTGARLRSYWSERQSSGAGWPSFVERYWRVGLIVALIAIAAGLRLIDLDERAIHHDESIHIQFAYNITQGVEYRHDPVYHGPFQYFGTAGTFLLFGGASDYTARLLPALFGIALVGLPFLLRKQLGTLGAFAAAGLLAFSPTLIYFSRFARNDIYVAFFTLAIVIAIWRYMEQWRPNDNEESAPGEPASDSPRDYWAYLKERGYVLLIAIGPLLALSFAAKEVTFITVAILLVYMNILVANDLVEQLRRSRSLSPEAALFAYIATLPLAWAIVALWPLIGQWRRQLDWNVLPAAGAPLIIVGTLVLPQFAAAIQYAPFIEDEGYRVASERTLIQTTILVLIFGSAFVGVLWKPRVWLPAALLFYIPYVLLFTSFFTNLGGFWSGGWDSLDYWLQQQGVQRGSQPQFYYLMLLPVYEFLPLVFALGGALYYAFRGRLDQILIAGSALLLIVVVSLLPDDAWLIGGLRVQATFVIAIGAALLVAMDGFTKFLLFWTLAMLFSLTVAGEKMPWLTVHLALPLALLAAKVLSDIFSTVDFTTRRAEQRERPASETTAALASAPSWRAVGQLSAAALFAVLFAFTVWTGVRAAFDEGESGGTPEELLIYAQGSPQLDDIRDEIDRLARESGLGRELPIVVDLTANEWPWPWYLREYWGDGGGLSYTHVPDDFSPQPGSVVLITAANQSKMEPFLPQYQEGIPYTHMWWFPEVYRRFDGEAPSPGRFLSAFFQGSFFSTWRDYFIDRTVPGATTSPDWFVYFPKEFQAHVPDTKGPPPAPPIGTAELLDGELQTIIGIAGSGDGEFSQPAGLALDAAGNLYVVDTLNQRVQKFAPDGSFIAAIGRQGTGPGEFANPRAADSQFAPDGPWGAVIDELGNVYVADTWNHRIQKYNAELELLPEWSIGGLFGPRDIAIDIDGNLLIVDTGNKRILKYTPAGLLLESYGGEGDGPGEFNEPSSISVTSIGEIYVADYWNQRIQHFDATFTYIDEFAVPTWGSQGVTDRPYIVALDEGTVLATDPASARLIVFDAAGAEIAAWRLIEEPSRPIGIVADGQGQIYLSDGLTSEVRRVLQTALIPVLQATPAP